MKLVFLSFGLMSMFANQAIAADSAMCDLYMNMTVGLADSAARIEGGSLKVDAASKEYMSRAGDSQAKVRMLYFPGHRTEPAVIATDVSVVKSGEILTISRRADASVKFHPTDVIGYESKFDVSKSDRCELLQNVALFRDAGGVEAKRLAFDKKYCDSVREILGEHGDAAAAKEKLRTCTDLLGNVQEVFNVRKAELAKEKILMSDSARPMSTLQASPFAENAAGLMLSLMANCAPRSWTEFGAELRPLTARGTTPANSTRGTKK